jgi:hypothetical protein
MDKRIVSPQGKAEDITDLIDRAGMTWNTDFILMATW